jgi:hypothetical protein
VDFQHKVTQFLPPEEAFALFFNLFAPNLLHAIDVFSLPLQPKGRRNK